MPAAFVVPRDRAEAPHWQLKGGAGSLTAGVEGEATTPLLSEDPGLAEVMAASSAAQGLLGSQTMRGGGVSTRRAVETRAPTGSTR